MLVVHQVSFQIAGSLTDVWVDTQRRKHLAYLMADEGSIINPESARNLPKQVSTLCGFINPFATRRVYNFSTVYNDTLVHNRNNIIN